MRTKRWIRCAALLLAAICLLFIAAACGEESASGKSGKGASGEEPYVPKDGFVTIDGVRFFYENGALMVDTIVGSDDDGYFYTDKSGAINDGYCNGVTVNDEDWIVIEGQAYKVETESDKCLFAAAKDIGSCTTVDMTREEKVQAAFDYIKDHYLEGVPHDPPYSYTKTDWPIVCANDLFIGGKGDCYSYGAAFAYMARAIGYTEVYGCNSGGHGWTEIEGKIYDPEWSKHSSNYTYFGMSYEDECDVPYAKAIADEADYKRMKIEIHADLTAA